MVIEINDTGAAQKALLENRDAQREIASWMIDLRFCSRMLEIYGLKAETNTVRDQIEKSQDLVDDFLDLRLNQLVMDLRKSEQHLVKVAQDALLIKDREMSYRQASERKLISEARNSYNDLRHSLYSIIEDLKSL